MEFRCTHGRYLRYRRCFPYNRRKTTPIAEGVPNLTGDWEETSVTINGIEIAAQSIPHRKRIEQCGNRILVASNGVLHEVFQADSTLFNGVNEVDPTGLPVHLVGKFEEISLSLLRSFLIRISWLWTLREN